MGAMTDECEQYKEELDDEKRRNDMLKKEAEALRKTLQDAQRKNASLEAEVSLHMNSHSLIIDISSYFISFMDILI